MTQKSLLRPGMLKRLYDNDLAFKTYPTLDLGLPLFVGIGERDTKVQTATQLHLVDQLCSARNSVEVRTYPGLDHDDAMLASVPHAIEFARHILAGRTPNSACGASGSHAREKTR